MAAHELVRIGRDDPATMPNDGGTARPAVADPDAHTRRVARWERRARFILEQDPDGCRVAEDGSGTLLGVVMSLQREKLWALSAFFVRPGQQGAGIGAKLLDTALAYSRGCLRGILISTEDPRAARRYRLAGFTLHPTIRVAGVVDRAGLPAVEAVRIGGRGDWDLCDSVDRRARGAAHGVDHEHLTSEFTLLVTDQLAGSGYCYVDETGSPMLLGATSKRIAGQLLTAALLRSPPGGEVAINYLTAEQEWAVDIAMAARLSLRTEGYLALRHMRPPVPYIPSGPLL